MGLWRSKKAPHVGCCTVTHKELVSPLHCVPYPGWLLADGHVQCVDVSHLGGDDGRQLRVSQLPGEEGPCLAGGGEAGVRVVVNDVPWLVLLISYGSRC